ncbi:hypothetical protein ACHAW5_003454, partial [Stephanodiscus triporus]
MSHNHELTRLLPASSDETKFLNRFRSYLVSSSIVIIIIFLLVIRYMYGDVSGGQTPSFVSWEGGAATARRENDIIRPGSIFSDTRGVPINAHGGGFLFHGGTYYWYGEIKSGPTYLPASNAEWGGSRVDLVGISCYASSDLLNWEHRGNVLPASDDPDDDLYRDNVAERPKVAYNDRTGKFVMWLHVDGADYARARCGVATSDRPEGPFRYVGSFRPNGQMARDLTVFVDDEFDDDGGGKKAYLLVSSEDNASIHASELTDDYTNTTGNYTRIFVGNFTEAPSVFKRRGRYYFIGSGCTAWRPNPARSAVSSSSILVATTTNGGRNAG